MVRNRFLAAVTFIVVVGGTQFLMPPVRATSTPAPLPPSCPPVELCRAAPTLVLDRDVIPAGELVVVTGTAHAQTAVTLLAYSRPSTTYRVVRRGRTDAVGDYTFTFAPSTSSRLFVQSSHGSSPSVLLLVRRIVSLRVISTSGCRLTAIGSAYPHQAGVPVDVAYRRLDGRFASAMSTLTRANGTYSVGRAFGGCGQTLTWRAATPDSVVNLAGVSPLRIGRLVR